MNVIDLARAKLDRTAHVAGPAFCMGCRHEWTGIWPVGTVDIECPECKAHKGRSKFNVMPDEDQIWTCMKCDNQLFNLMPTHIHCPGCGMGWGYGELT